MSNLQFRYENTAPACSSQYLWEPLQKLIEPIAPPARVLDVGCGNGDFAGRLLKQGFAVTGIDLSESGIAFARDAYPTGRFEIAAADQSILDHLKAPPFDLIISTEVVEHLYDPKSYARGCFSALRPGGRFICSTPYHGYLKNLAVALAGGFDKHVSPLWDGGHIKFWSRETLGELLTSAGFVNLRFAGAGRIPKLWKSMLISGEKPA